MLRQPHSPVADAILLRGSLCAKRAYMQGALVGNHVHPPIAPGEQRNAALSAVRAFGIQAMAVFTDAVTAASGLVRGRGGSAGSDDVLRAEADGEVPQGAAPPLPAQRLEMAHTSSQLSIEGGAAGADAVDIGNGVTSADR